MPQKPSLVQLQQKIRELERETARLKQVEAELRNSEERFRELAELLPQIIFEMDAEGRLIFVNQRAFEHFQYTRQEFEQGLNAFDIIIPEDRTSALENVKKILNGKRIPPNEYSLLRKDQSTFPAIVLSAPVMHEKKPVGLRGIIIDITERKKAEEALRGEKERFRVLVEEAPLGIALIEKSGRYKYINPKFTEIFGYALEDIPDGRTWFEKAYPDPLYRKRAILSWKNEFSKKKLGKEGYWVFKVTCRDGALKTIQFRPAALDNDDCFIIYEDITEQKQLEAQLMQSQKLEAIGTLTSGISHNFRNILTVILMNCEILKKKYQDDARLSSNVDSMISYAKRGSRLVDELMEFSRQEPKKEFQPLNLSVLLKEIYQLLENTLDKVIQLQLKVPESIPVIGDYSELSQVFMNLATNARDAMPGGGRLRIEAGHNGKQARVLVSDSGQGMDKATLERCFEPFFTTKPVDKGTGLGLSTAYGTVKKHGGEITVFSEPGKGTTFELYFPISFLDEKTEPRPVSKAQPVRNKKILVVDDEAAICKLLTQLLSNFGFQAEYVLDGKGALKKFKQFDPDLVLLDINMPEMSGKACAEELIKLDPKANIVMMSGYEMSSLSEKHQKLIKGFLTKPINTGELLNQLDKVLE